MAKKQSLDVVSTPETMPFLKTGYSRTNDPVHEIGTTKWTWTQPLIFMGGALMGMLITILIFSPTLPQDPVYSKAPFRELNVHYISKPFISDVDSPYAQKPDSDVDNAWNSLLANMHMRASAEELAIRGQKSVSLDGDDEYFVWLDVFHQLHCINMLRKWIYRDYYHVNITDIETEHMSSHADHCLDIIRQAVICHPDPSLTTFRWSVNDTRPMFDTHLPLHTCVDFDILMDSVQDREVDDKDIRKLKNPLLSLS